MVRIVRIADLEERLNGTDWAVLCRVVARFSPRTFSRSNGEGVVQNAIIKDDSGVSAQIAIFNEKVDEFAEYLQPGQCLQIRNLLIKPDTHAKARWKFSLTVGAATSAVAIDDLPKVDMKWQDNRADSESDAPKPGAIVKPAGGRAPPSKNLGARLKTQTARAPYSKPGPKNRVSPSLVAAATGVDPRDFVDLEAEEDEDSAELHHHH